MAADGADGRAVADGAADAAIRAAATELVQRADRSHALPDGRVLSYVDCGDSESADCVLFLHPVQANRCMSAGTVAAATRWV
jgi:hypothetical protein